MFNKIILVIAYFVLAMSFCHASYWTGYHDARKELEEEAIKLGIGEKYVIPKTKDTLKDSIGFRLIKKLKE